MNFSSEVNELTLAIAGFIADYWAVRGHSPNRETTGISVAASTLVARVMVRVKLSDETPDDLRVREHLDRKLKEILESEFELTQEGDHGN